MRGFFPRHVLVGASGHGLQLGLAPTAGIRVLAQRPEEQIVVIILRDALQASAQPAGAVVGPGDGPVVEESLFAARADSPAPPSKARNRMSSSLVHDTPHSVSVQPPPSKPRRHGPRASSSPTAQLSSACKSRTLGRRITLSSARFLLG
jgi:hypothetical protein